MTKNPYLNAGVAAAYIVLVATMMTYAPQLGHEKSVLVPIAVLSLFVFSAAFMGVTFFLQPVQMYMEGAKKEAVELFLRTLGTFAALTALFFIALFLSR